MSSSGNDSIIEACQNVLDWMKITIITGKDLKTILERHIEDFPITPDPTQPLPPLPEEPVKPTIVIGLSGRAQVGKSTMGKMFEQRGFQALALADSIRDISAYLYGFDRKVLEGDTPERQTIRNKPLEKNPALSMIRILQLMGTEVFRSIASDIWIHHLLLKITHEHIVITDARYPNERKFVSDMGGRNILVTKKGVELTNNRPAHTSEESLGDYYDYESVVNNDGSLESLDEYVASVVEFELSFEKINC